jgi:molybdopterin-containing oxidoreductase family iron-sulfur binding subunit
MSLKRREFLRLAGYSLAGTLLSIGGGFVVGRGSEILESLDKTSDKKAIKWAMAIDTRAFKSDQDFEKVIKACHQAHNVPNIPDKDRAVKWIWMDTFQRGFPTTETTYISEDVKKRNFLLLCNHCDDPPCVRVCPVQATFKREDGIVMQDMHRCIGCKFCMAACPYGSRNYNFYPPREYIQSYNPEFPTRTLGVVEKCIFCYHRLDEGKLPYCVEASEGKMFFGNLNDPASEVRKIISENIVIVRKPELTTRPKVFYII